MENGKKTEALNTKEANDADEQVNNAGQGQPSENSKRNPVTLPGSVSMSASVGNRKPLRRKRKPSRYQDAMFDIPPKVVNTNREISNEKSTNSAISKSSKAKPTKNENSSRASTSTRYVPSSQEEGVTFDENGHFKFKVCKQHTFRSKGGSGTSYRCDVCEMVFPRSFSLSRHYERIHINPRYVKNKRKKDLDILEKITSPNPFRGTGSGNQKIASAENTSDKSNDKEKPADGDIEGRKSVSFNNPEGEENNPTYYIYACKICVRQQLFFKVKDGVRQHHQAKHNFVVQQLPNVFKCDSCERIYSTRHELQRHKRSHSGERPYACRFCEKRFPTSTNARRHERTHTGDRPHICKVCEKRFIQKNDMVKHLRSIHKMKVTKTKAERAVKKKKQFRVEMVKSVNDLERTGDDKSIQFEENIDFAAYLNLDRFEKGSLMGGKSTERRLQKQKDASDTIQQTIHETSKGSENLPKLQSIPQTVCNDVIVKDINLNIIPKTFSCSECAKAFSSKVNLRRHYRLKHERQQIIRASMPVSMVVEKYKIQEESEGTLLTTANEKKLVSVQEIKETVLTSMDDRISSECNTKDEHDSSVDISSIGSPVSQPVSSEAMDNDASTKHSERTSVKAKRVKDGSKLKSILERLSNRQEQQQATNIRSSLSKESTGNLNLSVLNQTGKCIMNVSKTGNLSKESVSTTCFDSPKSEKVPLCLQNNEELKKKVFSSRSAVETKQTYIQPKTLYSRRSQMLLSGNRNERFQPYFRTQRNSHSSMSSSAPSRFHLKSQSKLSQQKVFKYTHRGAFAVTCPGKLKQDNSTSALPYSVVERKHRNRRALSLNETLQQSQHYSPHCSRSGVTFTPKASFLDKCWNSKMNNVLESGHRRASLPTSMQLLQKAADSDVANDRRDKDLPLDLRHPSKLPKPDYRITDEGVLDFSLKTRKARYSGDIDNSVNKEKINPGIPPPPYFIPNNTYRRLRLASQVKSNTGTNMPLKFHDVRFDKGRQTQGAGIGGRPMKVFRGVSSKMLHMSDIESRDSHSGINRHKYGGLRPHGHIGCCKDNYMITSMEGRRIHAHGKEDFIPIRPNAQFNGNAPPPAQRYNVIPTAHIKYTKLLPKQVHYNNSSKLPSTQNSLVLKKYGVGRLSEAKQNTTPNTFKMPVCRSGDDVTSDENDREVMKRCINKANRELNRQLYANEGQDNSVIVSTVNPGITENTKLVSHGVHANVLPCARQITQQSMYNPNNTNELVNLNLISHFPQEFKGDESNISNTSLEATNPVLSRTPIDLPEYWEDNPNREKTVSPRENLTMTPGFDTNGDEFVPEIDMRTKLSDKEASTGLVTLSKDPAVMSADQPEGDSDVDKYPEIPCTIRSGLSASNPFYSIPVIEESNIGSHLVQDTSIVATSKTVIAAANISVEEALFNNELKETNLNKQETTSAVSQLKETNLSKDTGFEKLPEGMNTNNTSQDDPMGDNSPKKFVQKLKLRAVTSQEKDGATAKKWTLVDEKPLVRNHATLDRLSPPSNEELIESLNETNSLVTFTTIKSEARCRTKAKSPKVINSSSSKQHCKQTEQPGKCSALVLPKTFTKKLDLYSVKIALTALRSIGIVNRSLKHNNTFTLATQSSNTNLTTSVPKLNRDTNQTIQKRPDCSLATQTNPDNTTVNVMNKFHVEVNITPQSDRDGVIVEDKVVTVEFDAETKRTSFGVRDDIHTRSLSDVPQIRLKPRFQGNRNIEYIPSASGDHSYSKTLSRSNILSKSNSRGNSVHQTRLVTTDHDVRNGGKGKKGNDVQLEENSSLINHNTNKTTRFSPIINQNPTKSCEGRKVKVNLISPQHKGDSEPTVSLQCIRNKPRGSKSAAEHKMRSIRKYSKNFVSSRRNQNVSSDLAS